MAKGSWVHGGLLRLLFARDVASLLQISGSINRGLLKGPEICKRCDITGKDQTQGFVIAPTRVQVLRVQCGCVFSAGASGSGQSGPPEGQRALQGARQRAPSGAPGIRQATAEHTGRHTAARSVRSGLARAMCNAPLPPRRWPTPGQPAAPRKPWY